MCKLRIYIHSSIHNYIYVSVYFYLYVLYTVNIIREFARADNDDVDCKYIGRL